MDLEKWYFNDSRPVLMNERMVRARLGADVMDQCAVLCADEMQLHPLELMGHALYVGREVETGDCWIRAVLCPDLTGAGQCSIYGDYRVLFYEVRYF